MKAEEGKTYDVVISYCRTDEDREKVEKIRNAIQESGFNVWYDQNIDWGTKNFRREITRAFNDTRMILFCISEAFNKSEWCKSELDFASSAEAGAERQDEELHVRHIVISGGKDVLKEQRAIAHEQVLFYENNPQEIARHILKLLSGNESKSSEEDKPVGGIKDLLSHNSWLSPARRQEIAESRIDSMDSLKAHRKEHFETMQKYFDEFPALAEMTSPAWCRISPTDSEEGARLIIGFKHNQCLYRKSDPLGLGCLNCGYYAGTGLRRPAETPELLQQLYKGLEFGFTSGKRFDVLEFLSDGSFLNDGEISDRDKEKILENVSKIPRIKRLLVETTPEHVTSQDREVESILDSLRDDQILEIGIGLETKDNFIRPTCINKGFDLCAFERAAEKIAQVSAENDSRCRLVAYQLVKPAFLEESEAIEDCMRTLRYLNDLSRRLNLDIIPKLEPAVVSKGTILSLLYEQGNYKPLSYWSVLEILTRSKEDSACAEIADRVRIGAREDMDDVAKVSAIYEKDGKFHQLDFVLYEAVQRYNVTHDLPTIFTKLNECKKRELCRVSGSLHHWARSTFGEAEESAAFRRIAEIEEGIDSSDLVATENVSDAKQIEFLKDTYFVLDVLEGWEQRSDDYIPRIMEISKSFDVYADSVARRETAQIIHDVYSRRSREMISVTVNDLKKEEDGKFLRVFFDVTDFISDRTYSIWSEVGNS